MPEQALDATWRAWRDIAHPSWLLVWVGQATSVFGDSLQLVAQSWYVFATTSSYTSLGVVNLCALLPWMLLGWLGGSIGDRADRRRLLIACDLVRTAAVGTLPLVLTFGALKLWHICLVTGVLASMRAVFEPTMHASVPNIVGRDGVYRANSMMALGNTIGSMIGMTLGGVLVDTCGPALAFALNAASFAVSSLTLWLARFSAPRAQAVSDASPESGAAAVSLPRALAGTVRVGVRFLLVNPWLVWVQAISVAVNFAVAPFSVLLPGYSKEILHAGASGVGLVQAGISAGILAASLVSPLAAHVRNPLSCVALSLAGIGVGFAGMGLSDGIPVAVSCAVVTGLGMGAANILVLSLMQRSIPDRIQGSLYGLSNTLTLGLRPLGVVAGSLAAGAVGVRAVFVGCAALILLVDCVASAALTRCGGQGLAATHEPK